MRRPAKFRRNRGRCLPTLAESGLTALGSIRSTTDPISHEEAKSSRILPAATGCKGSNLEYFLQCGGEYFSSSSSPPVALPVGICLRQRHD